MVATATPVAVLPLLAVLQLVARAGSSTPAIEQAWADFRGQAEREMVENAKKTEAKIGSLQRDAKFRAVIRSKANADLLKGRAQAEAEARALDFGVLNQLSLRTHSPKIPRPPTPAPTTSQMHHYLETFQAALREAALVGTRPRRRPTIMLPTPATMASASTITRMRRS